MDSLTVVQNHHYLRRATLDPLSVVQIHHYLRRATLDPLSVVQNHHYLRGATMDSLTVVQNHHYLRRATLDPLSVVQNHHYLSDSGSPFGGSKPSLSAVSGSAFNLGGSKPSLSSVSGSAFNLGGSKPSLSSLSDSGFTFDGSKPSLSGVPYTDQTNTNSCEINAESGHGTTSTAEVLSNLQKVNIEEEIAGKESNNTNEVSPLTPSCIKKEEEAREANPEAAKTSSLMVISRILKGIPQDPHFYQLRNHSELARKIMICSWDQIFLETAEKIHSLQPNGFWVRARELWKTMEELQSMGYNVIPLRRRLVELTNVMTDLKLFKSNIKGLKIKAEDHRAEKRRLKFVILSLQEIIMGEEEGMERVVAEVMDLEKELPKFDEAFANLALEPL
ncbi:uncharacterized protein LOC110624697 isoform X47 [Manihot esculenta]|uniref:uncharacterized protein LOC110624697 isoform X47 n=1 Tax=Manihot esculenta TaxID=3983 RepID=UPI001CC64490|nr:uncharacterized protein LOC110624697 isoform X47 [Manihot esculenta]